MRRARARCSACPRSISPICRARRKARSTSRRTSSARGVPHRVGQLNVEAYCLALSKVYTFGPTFRAENSNTSRHPGEFWMIEPRSRSRSSPTTPILPKALLKHIFKTVLAERADDMAFFEERIEKGVIAKLTGIVDHEFVRMDYTEAIRILETSKHKFEFPVSWGIDLQSSTSATSPRSTSAGR
jgi:aspartyl/asparaginyl-tRNA synthetase